jgi:hypothetical protein
LKRVISLKKATPTMFAQRPHFFEPIPTPSFHVPLLTPIALPSNTCDNCVSCQLWKQLMAMCDAHDFRTELPIGLVD